MYKHHGGHISWGVVSVDHNFIRGNVLTKILMKNLSANRVSMCTVVMYIPVYAGGNSEVW